MSRIIKYAVWVREENVGELLDMYRQGRLVDYDWLDSYEEDE